MTPQQAVARHVECQPPASAYCIAFSGGLDSHMLLLLLWTLRRRRQLRGEAVFSLRALHVDHQLHPKSAFWARHCHSVCQALEVPLQVQIVSVVEQDEGLEAAARRARYRAFAETLAEGEQLLLAQHADDQAETFLLQALRGSGPAGLAGMPVQRRFHRGTLARPLLGVSRAQLVALARCWQPLWIEDPSNGNAQFDRNFLRQSVLPLLRQRWPACERTLGRAARHCARASGLLEEQAAADLAALLAGERPQAAASVPASLPVGGLHRHSRERANALLRHWVRSAGYRLPRLQDLDELWRSVLADAEAGSGALLIDDYAFRRYRDRLYLLARHGPGEDSSRHWSCDWIPSQEQVLQLPHGQGVLHRDALLEAGIELAEGAVLEVRNRRGGERIRLERGGGRKRVKKLLQEAGIPPWQRDQIPLLYKNGELIAVWGVAVAAPAAWLRNDEQAT